MPHLPWRIDVLGSLIVGQEDHVITRFRSYRTGALLAYLVCHSKRAHPREELIDLFWPDATREAGRATLRTALSSLRRQLEPPGIPAGSVLSTDRINVRINPHSFTCDLIDFEAALLAARGTSSLQQHRTHLMQAIGLYKGPLLPGYYEDWITSERERLEADYAEAQHQIAALPLPDVAAEPAVVTLSPPVPSPVESPSDFPFASSTLPSYLTRFFGRTEEIERLRTLIIEPGENTRLLTLTGMGGAGKTRLAIVVAKTLREIFMGAVWFVDLSDLQSSEQIPNALLEAFGVSCSSLPLEQVIAALSRQPSLLILDNFEHLLTASQSGGGDGASFLWMLLQRVPTLTCLVTSRQALAISGEQEFPVLPMRVPTATDTPENLMQFASVQMFVDRAQTILPDFQITPGNAKSVAALCAQLEGIPLAIELAAAWAQTLTPAQMRSRLEKRFDFLMTRRRDLSPRHRTLRATLEWSYGLLSPDLQRFFIQLSVFRGGWTLDAAAVVCESPHAMEHLQSLQERSLIVSEEVGQERRFRLLETLREFGWEQLSRREQEALQERRTDYYLQLARMHSGMPYDLEREHENLRRSLAWCHATNNAEKGLRLAVALRYVWMAGYGPEGEYWIKHLLALVLVLEGNIALALQAEAVLCAAMLSLPYSDFARAQHFVQQQRSTIQNPGEHDDTLETIDSFIRSRSVEALEAYLNTVLEESEPGMTAFALCCTGNILRRRGETARGRELLEESLTLYRTREESFGLQFALNSLGDLLMEHNDYGNAIALFEECLAHCRPRGYLPGILRVLWLKGTALQRQGDREQAADVLEESLHLCREQGDQENLLGLLRNVGFLALEREDYETAHALFAEGLTIAQRLDHQETSLRYLRYLGVCAFQQKEYANARGYFEAHLALSQGMYGLLEKASSLTDIALTFLEEGKTERAGSLLHQSLILFGDQPRMHYALEGAARLAVHLGQMIPAAQLFGAAESLREQRLVELPVVLRVHRDPLLAFVSQQIGEEAFRHAWAQGRTLSSKEALDRVLLLIKRK